MPSFMVGAPSACQRSYHHALTVYEHGVVNKNSKATSEASVLQRMDTVIKLANEQRCVRTENKWPRLSQRGVTGWLFH